MGLLLLRFVAGSILVGRAGVSLWSDPTTATAVPSMFLAGSGVLLIPGLWTPVVGAGVALIELWQLLALDSNPLVTLLVGTIGGALAMLGPGVWSVDARLFGWRRVDASPARAKSSLSASGAPRPYSKV